MAQRKTNVVDFVARGFNHLESEVRLDLYAEAITNVDYPFIELWVPLKDNTVRARHVSLKNLRGFLAQAFVKVADTLSSAKMVRDRVTRE